MEIDTQHLIDYLESRVRTEENWRELSRRIRFHSFRIKLFRYARNAAAILLLPLLVASYALLHTAKGQGGAPAEVVEQTAARGLVSKITLPDGSDVWLNSGSTIRYPRVFAGGKRQVSLEGEAYFKVQADQSRRFDVLTDAGLTVSAFGTEFNVLAYEEEKSVEATLVAGHLEVSANGLPRPQIISPGQHAIFDRGNRNLAVTDVNTAVITSWKDGKMIFRRAGMEEVARRLARHFNVDIRLEGKELYSYEYSATFTTETLNEILSLLEKSAPLQCKMIEPKQSADYSYSKRTVIISKIKHL